MVLTKENIQEWKADLDKKMFERYQIHNFSDTVGDEDWIEDNLGDDVEEVIEEEIFWSSQN